MHETNPGVTWADGSHTKDALLTAEVRPPFEDAAEIQWVRIRRPFCRQSVLIAVDGRRLPAPV